MKQDTSQRRQQEIVAELIELIRYRDATQQQLEDQWRAATERCVQENSSRRRETLQQLHHEYDKVEADYRQRLATSQNECQTQRQLVTAEVDEKLEEAALHKKTATSDGEYDWFLSKQRLQKEFNTDEQAIAEAHQQHKVLLHQHRQNLRELTETTTAVLARHRCDLTVQGGDLLEEPDDTDNLQAHLQTVSRIQELIRQFRHSFWVRFIEERWFLIVFLLASAVLALLLGVALRQPFVPTAIATALAAIVISLTAWQIGRSLAAKAAHQFLEPMAGTIATGKQQLLAARQQAKRQTEVRLSLLSKQCQQRLSDLDG